jgi:GT2 family glycosyltransferase
MNKKVAAVIVTYNRLALLKECVQALATQERLPDAIIVVNNGSTDGTDQWLDSQKNIIAFHQENSGGAGGFHRGMREAYDLGFDWIWVMDDDGYPHAKALQALLDYPVTGPCILNSLVLSKDDSAKLAFSLKYNGRHVNSAQELMDVSVINGDINPFNGTLIAREIFTQIGFPKKEMFIWGDETEFCTRVAKNGFPLITVTSSIFYHPKAKEETDKDWKYEVIWRKYYGMRNQSLILKNTKNSFYKLYYTKYMAYEFLNILKYQKSLRLTKFLVASEAYIDAILNDFSKRPANIKAISRLGKK